MLDLILVVGAFLSVSLLVAGLLMVIFSPRAAVLGRLDKAAGGVVSEQAPKKAGIKEDFLWVMGRIGRLVVRKNKIREIQMNLIKADVMMRAEEYIGLVLLLIVAAYVVVFLVSGSFLLGTGAALIGVLIPGMVVNSKKKKRSARMTADLPEALNIISSGLRAGFSFPQAVSVVVREMEGPLMTEFSRVLKENRLGKPMDDALQDMLGRIENDDLEMLITALMIQRQVGGNLAEVLDSISHTIRERVRIKGEINTLTAEGKLTAIILSLLPPGVAGALALLNPAFISTLVEETIGLVLIGVAIVLQIIGVIFIRRIVSIEV